MLDAGVGTVLRHRAVARVQRGEASLQARHTLRVWGLFICALLTSMNARRGANEKPDALSCIGLDVAGTGLEPATFGL